MPMYDIKKKQSSSEIPLEKVSFVLIYDRNTQLLPLKLIKLPKG